MRLYVTHIVSCFDQEVTFYDNLITQTVDRITKLQAMEKQFQTTNPPDPNYLEQCASNVNVIRSVNTEWLQTFNNFDLENIVTVKLLKRPGLVVELEEALIEHNLVRLTTETLVTAKKVQVLDVTIF